MNDKKIKKIAYGVTDYEKIVLDYSYYVDKTKYLKSIEEAGDYLFFIRPRRFGKTLFLSIMETYYDISKKDRFDLFYKGTQIHQNPTGERNSYLILKFNFSAVDPHPERIEASFLNNVRNVVDTFIHRYEGYLEAGDKERLQDKLEDTRSAADVLANVVNLSRKSDMKIYIIIDEYDNFANTILSTSGSAVYENLTHGEGFFRVFFNFLKEGTSGSGAPISRLFITGVSPVTLDDVTSGFNIGKNISIEPGFNEMLGFTETDVMEMIDYYRQNGLIDHPTEYLLDIMNAWYNNYIFSKDSKTTLFNSDMVLYFIDKYIRHSKIPDNLIDRNVRIDYGKLRHLIAIDSDRKTLTNSHFSRLKQIIEESEIESDLVEGFPVEKLIHAENFIPGRVEKQWLGAASVPLNHHRFPVFPEHTSQRVGDFSHRSVGFHSLEHRRHQVIRAPCGLFHLPQSGLDLLRIALCAQLAQTLHLRRLESRIDPQSRRRILSRLLEPVHSYDHPPAVFNY